MGELAEDLINGFSCSWCGIYFEEEHGYPVICMSCANSNRDILKAQDISTAHLPELGENEKDNKQE